MLFCRIYGRFGWKPIQSEARVTRDAVSGLYDTYRKSAVWKTVPCIEYILVLLVLSSRQLSFYHFIIPRPRPGLLSLRSVQSSRLISCFVFCCVQYYYIQPNNQTTKQPNNTKKRENHDVIWLIDAK